MRPITCGCRQGTVFIDQHIEQSPYCGEMRLYNEPTEAIHRWTFTLNSCTHSTSNHKIHSRKYVGYPNITYIQSVTGERVIGHPVLLVSWLSPGWRDLLQEMSSWRVWNTAAVQFTQRCRLGWRSGHRTGKTICTWSFAIFKALTVK